MGVTIATVRTTIATVTGNQTISTTDLGGLTPKACLFFLSRSSADGVAADNACYGFGMARNINARWRGQGSSQHGVTTTVTAGPNASTTVTGVANGAGTQESLASFVSFQANGVTINWTTASPVAYFITVIFFAGSDLTVDSGYTPITTAQDVTQTIATSFLPEVLICCNQANSYRPSIGFVNFAASITQISMSEFSRNAVTATTEVSVVTTNRAAVQIANQATPAALLGFEVSNPLATSFDVTPRLSVGNSSPFMWLALSFGGQAQRWVGLHTTPTTTGDYVDNGPGFRPQAIIQLPTLCEVAGTFESDADAGSWGFNVATNTAQYSNSQARQDNVTTSNTQSLSDDQLVNVPAHDGATLFTGTFNGFTPNGWSTNYTGVAGTAKLWPTLAIGETLTKAPPIIARPLRVWRMWHKPRRNF